MEAINPITVPTKMCRPIRLYVIGVAMFLAVALPLSAGQENSDLKIDYGIMQQDILKFELVVNEVVNGTFSSDPIVVVQKPKGAYLPGYGVTLSFTINIHRAVINTPFGQISRASVSPETKKRRIEDLKEKLIRALQESGNDFRQLRKDDSISVIAFIEDRNFPDEPNENKTIVLSAFKKDLDEFGRRMDRLREFKQRMKIVEY